MLFSGKRSFLLSSLTSLLFHGIVVALLSQILLFRPPSILPVKEAKAFFVIQEEPRLAVENPLPTETPVLEPVPESKPVPEVSEVIPVSEQKDSESFSSEEVSSLPLQKNKLQENIQQWWVQEAESVEKIQQEITQQTKSGLKWFARQTVMVPLYVSWFTQIHAPLVPKKIGPTIQKSIPTLKEAPVPQKETREEELPFRKARLKKQFPLQYPPFGERMGYEGLVKLRVFLSETGSVLTIEIVESSSYKVLDESAQQQVAKWIFEPAFRGEMPIESVLQIPVRFKLN